MGQLGDLRKADLAEGGCTGFVSGELEVVETAHEIHRGRLQPGDRFAHDGTQLLA